MDTGDFTRRSPGRTYSDEAIAEAVASSSTLREVVAKLGARPATGMLSHIRRRIAAAGIDTAHFPALNTRPSVLSFTHSELAAAAARSDSLRSTAHALGIPDDGPSRAALRRALREQRIGTTHFRHARKDIPAERLRSAIAESVSYAEAMRRLGLAGNDANHRYVQQRAAQLQLDVGHFTRTSRRAPRPITPKSVAADILRVQPAGSVRMNHSRLRRALDELGIPYGCTGCGNPGHWRGARMTLHIDHINGDWRDNRRENLRYLCPNCHAITDTWCGRKRPAAGAAPPGGEPDARPRARRLR